MKLGTGMAAARYNYNEKCMEVTIDFSKIQDWDTFKNVFVEVMGFPDFYGKNIDAWTNCVSYVDDLGAGMSDVTVSDNENLDINVLGTESSFKTARKFSKLL